MRGLLEAAHRSDNPLEMLQGLLVEHPTREMVEMLVPGNIDLTKAERCNLMIDIQAHLEQLEDPCSPIGWRSKFLYFATSMCHIFGTGHFYPDPHAHVITYLLPNQPMPYIWLDLDDEQHVKVVQHYRISYGGTLKLKVHCIARINDLKSAIYNLPLDTGHQAQLPSEEMLQLSLRLDLLGSDCAFLIARLTRPHPTLDCFVMLTFKGKFSGIYHKTKHPLIVNTIRNPASKS